jgi:hypothetical protein
VFGVSPFSRSERRHDFIAAAASAQMPRDGIFLRDV